MKLFFSTILFFITFPILAQTAIDLSQIDSVNIQVYNHTSKEMVTNESDAGWVLLAQKSINKKYIKKFCKLLSEPKNFSEERALLTHDNIQVYMYANGELILDFHLSTFTRNMFIEDGQIHRTWSITKKAEKSIIKLLKQLEIYELIQEDMRFPSEH